MMRRQEPTQAPLFSRSMSLSDRIPERHLLRRIQAVVDFDFVYHEVEQFYGAVGHPSVPPTIILKLMVLMVVDNVRSERELMATLPLRLDWLWFLGYDLESVTPTHSVLSKARKRWGTGLFETFFQRVIEQCIQAGIVDGRQVFVDSSLIDANASVDSLFDKKKASTELHRRLDEQESPATKASDSEQKEPSADQASNDPNDSGKQDEKKTAGYRSSTDPDATGAKHRGEKMRPRYATHRMIDASSTLITATAIGPGHQNEAELLVTLIEQHERRTEAKIETLTADSKYGVLENLVACDERGITTYVMPFKDSYTKRREGMFAECDFRYDSASDTYLCPAGQELRRTTFRSDRNAYKFTAPRKACRGCALRSHCTTAKQAPRSILRPVKQELIDRCRRQAMSDQGREARKSRMARMEGSFAWSSRLGYKKARWRGLQRMRIQDLLIATTQNCLILLRNLANLPEKAAHRVSYACIWLSRLMMSLIHQRPRPLAHHLAS